MHLPGFEFLEKQGEGTVGTVWRAYQMSLNRMVAIKVLHPALVQSDERFAHFLRQARAAAKIKHANVVQCFDVGEHAGVFYFVMEYVAGLSLAQWVERRGPLAPAKAVGVSRCVAEALESAWHLFGLTHNAIKPQNVMIDEDGTVKVADLGLSVLSNPAFLAAQIREGRLAVVPNYMSPEQAQCMVRQDCRSDIYSLGAVLYFMLTGHAPFHTLDPMVVLHRVVDGGIPNPRDENPSVTAGAAAYLARMMMRNPGDRFADWSEVIQAATRLESGSVVVQKSDPYAGSAIAPPAGARTASVNGTAASPPPARPVRGPVRWLAWAALAAWLAFLGYRVLDPVDLLFAPDEDAPALPAPPPTPSPAATNNAVRTMETPSRVTRVLPSAQDLPPGISPEILRDPVLALMPTRELVPLRSAVADALCAGDFVRALKAVEDDAAYPHGEAARLELDALRGVVLTASKAEQMVRNGLRNYIDSTVVLRMGNRERPVTLRAMAGDRINGTVAVADGTTIRTNTVTFDLRDVHPSDQGMLMGPASSVGMCVAKFLLHLKGRDFVTARIYAENCGPLSDALRDQADAERPYGQ